MCSGQAGWDQIGADGLRMAWIMDYAKFTLDGLGQLPMVWIGRCEGGGVRDMHWLGWMGSDRFISYVHISQQFEKYKT